MAFKFNIDASGNLITPETDTTVKPLDPMMSAQQQYGPLPPAVQPTAGVTEQLGDIVTGELRETPQSKGLPETTPLSAAKYSTGALETIKNVAGMLMAADDEGRANILRGLGAQVESDEKGNQILIYPDGKQEVLNRPGFSRADAIQIAFDTALFAPAAMATGGVGAPIARAALTGLAAGATEAGRQQASKALGTGEKTDPGRIVLTGLTGAVGEYIPGKIKSLREGAAKTRLGVTREMDAELEAAIRAGEQVDDVTEFGLFRGQVTMDLDELGRLNTLAELKGSSHVAAKALKEQDVRAYDRTINFLNSYAPEEVVEGAPERLVGAAEDQLKKLKTSRSKAARPLYEKALSEEGLHSAPETLAVINEALAGMAPSSPTASPLRKIQRYLTPEGETEGIPLRQMDRAYKDLGDMIETAKRQGKPALVRELSLVKEVYMGEIENITPAYKEAVKTWEQMSKPIDKYLKSVPGKLTRVDIEDAAKLDGISTQLFRPGTTVSTLKKSKQIIEAENPQAWRDITRYHMEMLLEDMKADTPAEFYRVLFQQPKRKKLLYAALDDDTARTMRYFEEGLRRAKAGRPGGSRTEFAGEARRTIDDGGIASTVSRLFTPLESAKKYFGGLTVEQRRNQVAKVLFDPRWRSDFKDLRRLSPNSDVAGRKLARIFQKAFRVMRPAATSQAPESATMARQALEIVNQEQ